MGCGGCGCAAVSDARGGVWGVVTPEYEVRVSSKLLEGFLNGKIYYRYDGARLAKLPANEALWPDRERLAWHGEEVWLG